MKQAFVFPGQGSQSVGMAKDFYDAFPVARSVFDEVDGVLGRKLSEIIFNGPIEILTQTQNAQPALMCVSIAILRVIEEKTGKKINELCDYLAGHSLGEYTALCASGAISLADTTKLLKVRGETFAEAGKDATGGMVALLGATMEQAEEVLARVQKPGEICQIANDNTVGQIVLSGTVEAMDRVVEIAKDMAIKKASRVPTSGAFHCDLMAPAAEKMRVALESVTFKTPRVPVIANYSVGEVKTDAEIKQSLLNQITGRVRWTETIRFFEAKGVKRIVEIGAGKLLGGFVKRATDGIENPSVNSIETMEEFLTSME